MSSTASLKINLQALQDLIQGLENPNSRRALEDLPKLKAIAALMGQAVRERFEEQNDGEVGWQPLRVATIRASVAGAAKKKADRMTAEGIRLHENAQRAKGSDGEQLRHILKRKGLLMKSVTTPGAPGNIWKTEGTNIIWGTDLCYAAIHNRGGTIKHPGSKNAFGRKGFTTKPHDIHMPQRRFLFLTQFWLDQIEEVAIRNAQKILKDIQQPGGAP